MDILELLSGLKTTIDELQAKLVDVEAAKEEIRVVAFNAGKSEGLTEGEAIGYAKGFEDGKASVGNGDKIYSQEELDQKISEAVAPLNEKISSLEVELQSVKDGIAGQVAEAVQAMKMELKAKVEALFE